ncbi:hypothetical protein [Aurantimicrobium sp. MWH-Uga1]|uniref:hypothetical protein n=1 Tax=Aurantimicrobium sp. MWH-Uga1 TaxID=2079575 RepID=UPI0013B05342|nr:hypothetical protein [Aurantimicrobium sp. MWH-Uga1]
MNTSNCPSSPPALVNGGFEDFSNPATEPNLASGSHNGSAYYGFWHGYANGPDQILFLKPSATPGAGQTANYVTGWRSTSPLIEIQRQVSSYSSRHDNAGNMTAVNPPLSGVATASTTGTTAYYDLYSAQAAQGTYWAELNAIDNSALFQDIEVPSSARLFWSLKHRGRTDTNEQMKVLIGPVANNTASTTQQTTVYKYAPTNVDKYSGYPTYGSSFTTESTLTSKLSDGWNRFEGTYPADTSQGAPATRTMRLQFEAVAGGFGWTSFGNLLDDIQFTAFMACPVTQTLTVGQTAQIDVTGLQPNSSSESVSYGIRQALSALGNTTAPSSQFATTGDVVSFTPTAAGTYTADYQVEMVFGGQTYSAASQITYVVSANPNAPTASNPPTLPATSAPFVPLGILGAVLVALGFFVRTWSHKRG